MSFGETKAVSVNKIPLKASTLRDKSGLLKAHKSLDLRSYLLLLTYSFFDDHHETKSSR
jgi:hypothetical protein